MALTQLAPPYPIFTDKNGDPLDNGYLYFGEVNKNPETNPIQVYYDSAFTQPAAQPLRTSNGYVMRNGSPALIYAGSQFSVTVRDKNNALVIYSPVGYGIDPGSVTGTVVYDDFVGDGATVNFTLSASPSTKNATNVYIDGVYQSKDNYDVSGSTLTFSTAPPINSAIEVVTQETSIIGGASSQQITYNQGGAGSVTRTVQSRLRDFVSVKDFGAVGDGVTDDTAAIQAALSYVGASSLLPRALFVPTGRYRITSPLSVGAYVYIIGETRRSIFEFDHNGTGLTCTGGIGRIEKLHFLRGSSFTKQGINLYFTAAPEWVLDAVRSSSANVGMQTKDSHLLSLKDCVMDQNAIGYLDEGRSFAQTWVGPQFYNNDYGCDLRSEHTFLGGAIELSIYNDVLLNVTADYQSQFRGVAQFYGVHFEAKDGLTASTDPNLLVGPNSSGANQIRLTLSGCVFIGNSSNRPAISLRRAAAVNISSISISGYGSPSAGIVATSDTNRLITSSIFNTVSPADSISTATKWTDLDGDNVQTNTLTIRDPYTPSAPSASTGAATIFIDPADNDLKIIFADGTVKTIVTDT